MAPLIRLDEVTIRFLGPPLLDDVSCQIESSQRIGLLGRNGSGKTTLMRIMCGDITPDSGQCVLSPGVKVARLPQDVPRDLVGRTDQVVLHGLPESDLTESHLWESEHKVEQLLSRMNLAPDLNVETLSSGMKRRGLLARALVGQPDVLLLDEPTNHLDIEAITWLEEFLASYTGAVVFVTHDRVFLERLATRIVELDRGRLTSWPGDYATFARKKDEWLANEELQQAKFDKKLASEEVWLRRGVKARRTRDEGRVKALMAMRAERAERRNRAGNVRMQMEQSD